MDKTPLYQAFFDLQMSICEKFPSMSPFDVRRERLSEVFLLMRRLKTQNKGAKKKQRRPAGDNWF